jgi:hypothetical protein
MEGQTNATSGKNQRSSASNARNGPARSSKRQKTTTPRCPATPFQNEGVLAAIEKLTQLVEHHPTFHSKLEEMLKDVYNTLEPEVPAATRANQCPWDENTCAFAAENGHLELLKWCRSNLCPWNQ